MALQRRERSQLPFSDCDLVARLLIKVVGDNISKALKNLGTCSDISRERHTLLCGEEEFGQSNAICEI
jgi:hypothetical protein